MLVKVVIIIYFFWREKVEEFLDRERERELVKMRRNWIWGGEIERSLINNKIYYGRKLLFNDDLMRDIWCCQGWGPKLLQL